METEMEQCLRSIVTRFAKTGKDIDVDGWVQLGLAISGHSDNKVVTCDGKQYRFERRVVNVAQKVVNVPTKVISVPLRVVAVSGDRVGPRAGVDDQHHR